LTLDTDRSKYINEKVVLKGVAADPKDGEVVLLSDGTPVYLDGLKYDIELWSGKKS